MLLLSPMSAVLPHAHSKRSNSREQFLRARCCALGLSSVSESSERFSTRPVSLDYIMLVPLRRSFAPDEAGQEVEGGSAYDECALTLRRRGKQAKYKSQGSADAEKSSLDGGAE
jgi:hypothetical protein